MKKNEKWIELLAGTKDFNEGELNKHIAANNDVQAGCMTYRNNLLKQMDTPNFTQSITAENLQKWFLEPISEEQCTWIHEDMRNNYWTIAELWERCKAEFVGILSISNQLNENMRFYEGMRIYHKGHVVNVLDEAYANEINFIKNDKNFNLKEFMCYFQQYTAPIALTPQVRRIRNYRIRNSIDFTMTKENVEYLSAELSSDIIYKMLKRAMKINHWTLKELVQESRKKDMNFFLISGCPNLAAREVM